MLPPLANNNRGLRPVPEASSNDEKRRRTYRDTLHGEQREVSRDGPRSGVILGLRAMQVSATARLFGNERATPSRGLAMRLHPISAVSKRANECVQEANEGPNGVLNSRLRNGGGAGGESDESGGNYCVAAALSGASRAFETLLSQVEESLHGNEGQLKVLRKGEHISESMPARGVRRYKISLPSRPVEVTVCMKLTSGRVPTMWASTRDHHPGSNNHEFAGKNDVKTDRLQIAYKHVLPPGDEDSGVDRRNTAPSCRELFVTVEALLGESIFVLSVEFGRANINLSRKEMSAQVDKLRPGWGSKVKELQRDAAVRDEFDDHLVDLRASAAERTAEMAHGRDFVKSNRAKANAWSPKAKLIGLHKQALKNYARHDAVSLRRADLEFGLVPGHEQKASVPRSHLLRAGAAVVHSPIEADQVPAMESP